MVESAKYFYDKLIHNTLGSAINLPKDATHATGLLGHSVGAGLATYMARQADKECGRPFKAVMYLAPATKFLVPKYTPETALQGWRPQDKTTTHLAVQYGGRDTTASKEEADGLVSKLRAACNSCSTNTSKVGYKLGTHVGFQDQLLVPLWMQIPLGLLGLLPSVLLQGFLKAPDIEEPEQTADEPPETNWMQQLLGFSTEDAAISAALRLCEVLPEFMTSGPSEDSTKDASGKDQHAMAVVRQITPEALLAQCAGLAVVEITFLCGSVAWQVQEHPLLTRCWGVFPVLGLAWCLGQGAQFMNLLGYEVNIQRPKMRESVVHFFVDAFGPGPAPMPECEPKLPTA